MHGLKTQFLAFTLLVLPFASLGATLYFNPLTEPIYRGDAFQMEIRLDSMNEPINAVHTDIDFPADLLEIISIHRGGSILRLWPQEPAFSNVLGLASLIGGLPTPGFQDVNGLIGIINFKAKNIGLANLKFREATRALFNDGLGSEAPLTLEEAAVKITLPSADYVPKLLTTVLDTTPPAIFTPVIGQSEAAFDKKYFVAFETQDLESGISHYEVQELKDGKWGDWRTTVSPHVLENQEGQITVFVKAVDRAGNETIGKAEVIIGKKKLLLYLVTILVLLGVLIWVVIQHASKIKQGPF